MKTTNPAPYGSESNMKRGSIILAIMIGVCAARAQSAAVSMLWYNHPANDWEREALPLGNGRLGAMLFGSVPEERIQFNEESLWIGDETDTGAYQAFGDVFIALAHGPVSEYRRELDLGRAVCTVAYESGGVSFRREAFASFPARVMVFRFTASKPGKLAGAVRLTDMHKGKISAVGHRLTSSGSLAGYQVRGNQALRHRAELRGADPGAPRRRHGGSGRSAACFHQRQQPDTAAGRRHRFRPGPHQGLARRVAARRHHGLAGCGSAKQLSATAGRPLEGLPRAVRSRAARPRSAARFANG